MPEQPQSQKHSRRHTRMPAYIALALMLILAAWGLIARVEDSSALSKETRDNAVPTVAVIKAPLAPLTEDVVLPGSMQAWHEAAIYARTSGYIKDWVTDIGSRVKAGDLLAEIETPEIDAQTRQAEADLATAEANNQLAQSTAKRWAALLKTNSVAKQDADEKFSDAAAKEALVASAQANLDHLKELKGFQMVTAPFDGIITARNTDTGALINAGSNGTAPELFHIAETDKLRIFVQVPEYDAPYIKPDLTAELYVAERPTESFTATLAHTADAIDPVARTLLVEFDADNTNGRLLPGSYVEVHIKIPSDGKSVRLPVNTLLFRSEGMQIATVDGDGKALLKSITIGRDYGREVEVTAGVDANEIIIVNPPDSLVTGQAVKIAAPRDNAQDKNGKAADDTKNSKDDKSGKDDKKSKDDPKDKDQKKTKDDKSEDNNEVKGKKDVPDEPDATEQKPPEKDDNKP